ncbi:hypothetical protein QAD02_014533 [Eretmocerus hayati]|uniref:Uncharacterized protein n=1 Tax=Eretmocerus hayati TaxID=131215 RepID=A0ACC2P791_9HYME|nr:hypothetical protein QAD02_014533 [Eretmocerus hayati]
MTNRITTLLFCILVTRCFSVPTSRFPRESGYESTTLQLDEIKAETESGQHSKIFKSSIEPDHATDLSNIREEIPLEQEESSKTDSTLEGTSTESTSEAGNKNDGINPDDENNPALESSIGPQTDSTVKEDKSSLSGSEDQSQPTELTEDPTLKVDNDEAPVVNSQDSGLEIRGNLEEGIGEEESKTEEPFDSQGDEVLKKTTDQDQVEKGLVEENPDDKLGESQEPQHPTVNTEEQLGEKSTSSPNIASQEQTTETPQNVGDSKQEDYDLHGKAASTEQYSDKLNEPGIGHAPDRESQPDTNGQLQETSLSNEVQADEPASDSTLPGEGLEPNEPLESRPDESSGGKDVQNDEISPLTNIPGPEAEYKNSGVTLPKDTEQNQKYPNLSDEDKSLGGLSSVESSEEVVNDGKVSGPPENSSTYSNLWNRLQSLNPLQLQTLQGYLPTWESLSRVQSLVPSWESISDMQSMIPWDSINQLQTNIPTWMNQLQTNIPIWVNQFQSSSPWQTMTQLINQWQPMDQLSRYYPELGNMMNSFMNLFS